MGSRGGKTFAAHFDGRAWSVQQTPTAIAYSWGSGSINTSTLTGVSCTSATACIAVGVSTSDCNCYYGEVAYGRLVERWDGSRWSILSATHSLEYDEELAAISCASRTSCAAVGTGGGRSETASWDGRRWRVQSGGQSGLSAVSCTTSRACTAVGPAPQPPASLPPATLAERFDGSTWKIQTTALTAPAGGTLNGVSCISVSDCTAVGAYLTAAGPPMGFVEHWNGSRWSIQVPPIPSGATSSTLLGISCIGAARCTAVGYFADRGGRDESLVESWNGTGWAIQSTASVRGGVCDSAGCAALDTVSCSSPTACVTGGWIEPTPADSRSLIETFNGRTWTTQSDATASNAAVNGISCTSPTACTAVGEFGDTSWFELIERWDGTAWTLQSPATASAISALGSVSCPSATFCMAINGSSAPEISQSWDGSTWTVQHTSSWLGNRLAAVSCVAASSCTAVGGPTFAQTMHALVERWDGIGWSIESTPTIAGPFVNGFSWLNGVSCVSDTACVAVGSTNTSPGEENSPGDDAVPFVLAHS